MRLVIDEDFRRICRTIAGRYEEAGDASLIYSDDEYQEGAFCGGWTPEAGRFYFSFYAPDGGDYIFSFTLEEARSVAAGGSIDPPLEYWKQAPDW